MSSVILPFEGHHWSSWKPRHDCPYHGGSTSMNDSWKDAVTVIRLCEYPPNVHPDLGGTFGDTCKRGAPYQFFHLSIDQICIPDTTVDEFCH
ncbi:hypothetical protein TNCV_1932201 [Trichonephila clavipes]|nr:hypothetical protein TNCV_1932201 [Trichonephila clavipes]